MRGGGGAEDKTTLNNTLHSPAPTNFRRGELEIKHDTYRDNPIKAAGQLPTGFDPAAMYNSRYQPRGLQTTIFGASDAIHSTGFAWDDILAKINPDEVGTYSASVAGQM